MRPPDTSPDAEQLVIEEARRMTPWEKLQRVAALNHEAADLEKARIRAQYGEISEEEMRLRLGALRPGRETMVKVFGWDPDVWGW